MALDRKAFTHLYVNANCLADLALRRELASVAAALEKAPAQEPRVDEAEPDIDSMFAGLDLGALDDLDLDDAGPFPGEAAGGGTPAAQDIPKPREVAADDNPANPPEDLGAYLREAYAVSHDASERIERMRGQLEDAALEALLRRLPRDVGPLTERLTTGQLTEWLARYTDGEPALVELVVLMRGLR